MRFLSNFYKNLVLLLIKYQKPQDYICALHDTTARYKPCKIKVFVMSIATLQHSAIQFLPLFCPSGVIKNNEKYAKRY